MCTANKEDFFEDLLLRLPMPEMQSRDMTRMSPRGSQVFAEHGARWYIVA